MRRTFCAALAAGFVFALTGAAATEPASEAPRFLSLKTPGANGRRGPSEEHRIDWIYQRVGLPLLVTGESGPWRRVRDPDGAETWMHVQHLADRPMAYVRQAATLRRRPNASAGAKAHLAAGVVAGLTGCDNGWARLAVGGRVGWVEARSLWGADGCAAAG